MRKTRDRLSLTILLTATAVLYLSNITVNGMANTFYSGATWAGTRSWQALLFGSVDPGNFITVDKPPVSQWIMGLSGRIFGFSSASLLVPEAIMGVLTVWLVFATVRRVAGVLAGFVAGVVLALTPVAALMFRFDNPDAVMALLMVSACYCTVRAAQRGSRWWLVLGGVALGFAFLAKMLEGVMSLPALIVLYFVAAPVSSKRKVLDVLLAAVAFVVSAGWYVALTMLWPASKRPYLAGSTDNSFLQLAFGYNGLSRVQGRGSNGMHSDLRRGAAAGGDFGSGASVGRAASGFRSGGGAIGGKAGITRLFSGEFGLEISWFLPAAFVALLAVLILRRGSGRSDLVRAAAVAAGIWLVSNGLVLSFMGGTTHAYYTLAIAAPIAILVGLGIAECWLRREDLLGRTLFALIVLMGAGWGLALWWMHDASWLPVLPWLVLVASIVGGVGFVAMRTHGRSAVAALALGVAAVVAAPAAVAINIDTTAHTGSSPSVNPISSGASRAGTSFGGGVLGGTRTTTTADPALVRLLRGSHSRWAAATATTSEAAALELASRASIMGIGGFTGSDPVPTLSGFENLVEQHRIGYYIETTARAETDRRGFGGTGFGPGSVGGAPRHAAFEMSRKGGTDTAILAWVKANFTSSKVGAATVYDLNHRT